MDVVKHKLTLRTGASWDFPARSVPLPTSDKAPDDSHLSIEGKSNTEILPLDMTQSLADNVLGAIAFPRPKLDTKALSHHPLGGVGGGSQSFYLMRKAIPRVELRGNPPRLTPALGHHFLRVLLKSLGA